MLKDRKKRFVMFESEVTSLFMHKKEMYKHATVDRNMFMYN